MKKVKSSKANKNQVRVRHPDDGPKGQMASIGGSRSDDWNGPFFDSLSRALPERSAVYSDELRQRAYSAAAVGLIEGNPADPIEAMLLGQIIVANGTANELHRLSWVNDQSFEVKTRYLALADKSQRTLATLVEVLNRHRGKGQQKVTVEHVHVHAGGQAIVGPVSHQGGGVQTEIEELPHAKAPNAPVAPLLGPLETQREAVPIASGAGAKGLPNARSD